MNIRQSITLITAIVAGLAASAGNASTVSMTPSQTNVSGSGTTGFELLMDFTGVTIQGGGVSLNLNGPISSILFAPTAYMQTLISGGFAGFGTGLANAGDDFGVYFGDFAGITGANKLGDITVNVTGTGAASIALFQSTGFPFEPLSGGSPLIVTGQGTSVLNVAAVPAPATAWLLATGMGAVGAWRGRKSKRTPVAKVC